MAYNKDTDYQALINEAVAKGNYRAAAQYEQQRNEKINDMNASGTNNMNYAATNKYTGWLDPTDYGTIGKQQMASGASAEDVLATYNKRYNKAATTEGLMQFANDDIQKEMWSYITENLNRDKSAPSFNYTTPQPTFQSSYNSRIDSLLDKLLNRDKFSYNAENDPVFQQLRTQYNREGSRAMNDTMAAAAANAGGMNSYAMTAAQQANDYYASQLGDKIPELYQLAYSMYLDDIDGQVRDLGLLQDMDSTQYGRYRDTMSDWRDDRNFAYDMYRDQIGDLQWNKQFDYNAGRDQVADDRYNKEWEYNAGRDQVSDDRYNKEWEYNVGRDQVADDRYNKEWEYNAGRDQVSDDRYNKEWEYNVGRDQVADDRYNREWAYNVGRDQVSDSKYQSQTAYNKAMDLLNAGAMPDATMLNEAGITSQQAAAILSVVQAKNNKALYGGRSPEDDSSTDDGVNLITDKSQMSAAAQKQLNSLSLMKDSASNRYKDSDGMYPVEKSVLVLLNQGVITDSEAEYMLRYFGYDPSKHFDY